MKVKPSDRDFYFFRKGKKNCIDGEKNPRNTTSIATLQRPNFLPGRGGFGIKDQAYGSNISSKAVRDSDGKRQTVSRPEQTKKEFFLLERRASFQLGKDI